MSTEPFLITRIADVHCDVDRPRWLVESLWSDAGVGILGGSPKSYKTFLALDIAVSVASGTPCLDSFDVPQSGPVLLFLAGVYGILLAWDADVTGLVASAGIVGLALSFAAQDTLANLFAGVAILADRPYQIGEYIILDSGERGEVTQIGLRSTRLLTRDDVEVSIPNGSMGSAKIVNEAAGIPNQYRIRVSVGVAYGSDIDKVMDVLLDVGKTHPKILNRPEPRVRFRQFGDSSLNFDLLCWIAKPAERGLVLHEVNCQVYRKFTEADIRIPFPQRDLYIKEMPQR